MARVVNGKIQLWSERPKAQPGSSFLHALQIARPTCNVDPDRRSVLPAAHVRFLGLLLLMKLDLCRVLARNYSGGS